MALIVAGCAAVSAIRGGSLSPLSGPLHGAWADTAGAADSEGGEGGPVGLGSVMAEHFPHGVLLALVLLLALSAYFSGAEVAFFSIHQVRLRGMAEEGKLSGRLVANIMKHPGRLLTTILIGNMIVNVLISVVMPPRLERVIAAAFAMPPAASIVLTVALSTFVLVFFGEITPKVFAVRIHELFARATVIPLQGIDWAFAPMRWGVLKFTEFLFRVSRISDIQPAPFITDEEFISVLSHSEAKGVIEEEEGQMIQGIIESGDAYVREILVPRPDVVALERNATVGEALEVFRDHEFSRMPVYTEDLDHVTGVLFAKDLLPCVLKRELDRPIGPMARRPNFVPETMTVRELVKESQRKHMHLSIVVDEHGGTEGIVTLEDAIEEVVGDIRDEDTEEPRPYKILSERCYLVDGSFRLDDLSELIGIGLQDSEHETVAGFFIDRTNKVPQVGDKLTHDGIEFTVEGVEGKRAAVLRVEAPRPAERGQPSS